MNKSILFYLLHTYIDKTGIEFYYHGDWVIWLWPWKRRSDKYISISLSGTGEFGDAKFSSLKEIDEAHELIAMRDHIE